MKLIEAEKAKDVIHEYFKLLMVNGASGTDVDRLAVGIGSCLKHDANLLKAIDELPSIQPKQNEMIKEIRRWVNSGNRGNADYFIVDRIEEIINAYEIN